MIDVSDLRNQKSERKNEKAQLVKCDKRTRAVIDSFKEKHGEKITAEVIRRLIRAGLPEADRDLSAG